MTDLSALTPEQIVVWLLAGSVGYAVTVAFIWAMLRIANIIDKEHNND